MANSTSSSVENDSPEDYLDVIHKAMMHLASADYNHRTLPEFLELLEEDEDFVARFRKFLGERK